MTIDKDLWEEIDKVAELDRAERKNAIVSLVDKLACLPQDDAEVVYARGYVLYFDPERLTDPSVQGTVEHAFMSALKLEPGHSRAQLYLGHHYFDVGRCSDALRCFDRVEETGLNPLLYIKARELAVCCRLRLQQLPDVAPALTEFIELADHSSDLDLHPVHLVNAAVQLFPESLFRDLAMSLYARIRNMLVTKGLLPLFATEIAVLDDWAAKS